MSLVNDVHGFWFENVPGKFKLWNYQIERSDIYTYGGPNPDLDYCEDCQGIEWMSRIRQKSFAEECCHEQAQVLCNRQGDELWTPWHRDFRFAFHVDPAVNAPKGAVVFLDERTAELWQVWHGRRGSALMPRLRKQFARAAQIDVFKAFDGIDWGRYDFLFFMNTGRSVPLVERPPVPIIMYAHDPWGKGFQEVLDHYRPEVLLTPYPFTWKRMFQIPEGTEVVFYPQPNAPFFARPNLTPAQKSIDLLVIGGLFPDHLYKPRQELNKQIKPLEKWYNIEHCHYPGGSRAWRYEGAVDFVTEKGQRIRHLNAYSEYLGSAKYVIFGPCAEKAQDMMLMKYYECLGSGAIPIMPWQPSMESLGIVARQHYLPFELVKDNNRALAFFLENYPAHAYIAGNAVNWYATYAGKLLYDGFENLVREVTEWTYPKRLIE